MLHYLMKTMRGSCGLLIILRKWMVATASSSCSASILMSFVALFLPVSSKRSRGTLLGNKEVGDLIKLREHAR